jgi:nitrogen fixation protein NifX
MKVAFATEDEKHVDAHFGWAKKIAIYDICAEDCRFVTNVEFSGNLQEDGNEDKLGPKLDAIKDCAILYVAAIGGSGAARVVTKPIEEILMQLQAVLAGNPPPWLRKALNKSGERVLDFEDEVTYG